jgi:phosphoglycerate dehydrogenase-like enzyme
VTKVVIIEVPENADRDLDIEREILGPDVDLVHVAYDGDVSSLVSICRDASFVQTDFVPFTRDVMSQLESCELVSVAATGYNSIDIEGAADLGINVCAIDEYCTDEVADHALTLILVLGRRLIEYHNQVQRDHCWQFDSLAGLARFRDLTLGVIGFGRIGRAVAKRAESFGMSILACDPYSSSQEGLCTLDELYAGSDIITLHCNLSPENRQMIDKAAFAMMSKNPILINVARGELINEGDLVDALDNGQISAAGLDVLQDESPDLTASPLCGRDNVVLTPHVAFYSDASIRDNRTISAQNIRHHLDGNHDAVRHYIHKVAN